VPKIKKIFCVITLIIFAPLLSVTSSASFFDARFVNNEKIIERIAECYEKHDRDQRQVLRFDKAFWHVSVSFRSSPQLFVWVPIIGGNGELEGEYMFHILTIRELSLQEMVTLMNLHDLDLVGDIYLAACSCFSSPSFPKSYYKLEELSEHTPSELGDAEYGNLVYVDMDSGDKALIRLETV
jgi:hypothetical protein